MSVGAARRDRWRAVRPLGHREFRLLFSAVVLSVFAAGMWAVVMVYAVIGTGGGPVALSVVAAANAAGLLVCAIPGGIVADRVSRRIVLRAVEAANVLAIASVVVAGWLGVLTVTHLTLASLVLGAGAGFFFPAYSAVLPRILPPAQLLAANGLESAIRPALQQAAGPAAAGLLLAALLPAQAAAFVLVAHVAALVVLLFLRPEPDVEPASRATDAGEHAAAPASAPDGGVRGILRDLREAVVFTVRTPWLLWTLLFATLWVLFTVGPETVLLPFVTAERFGDDPRLFGFLLAAFGAGGVVGSLFVSSLPLPRRYLTAMTLVWGFSTLPYVVVGLTHSYAVMAVCCGLAGFGFSYGNVIWGTLLQRRVPRHMLGRISSLDFFVSLALMPLSMALAGPVAQVVPLSVIFVVAGIVPFVISFVVLWIARMPRDEIAHPLTDAPLEHEREHEQEQER